MPDQVKPTLHLFGHAVPRHFYGFHRQVFSRTVIDAKLYFIIFVQVKAYATFCAIKINHDMVRIAYGAAADPERSRNVTLQLGKKVAVIICVNRGKLIVVKTQMLLDDNTGLGTDRLEVTDKVSQQVNHVHGQVS